jgi:Domain of unknown function (DUF4326)
MVKVGRQGTDRGIYIGRPSALGNPFVIGTDGSRAQVIAKYRQWLREQWRTHGPARQELERLVQRYQRTGQLTLLCWCAPHACHGDVIAEAIEKLVQRQEAVHS